MLHSAGYNPLALIPLLLWRQLCFLAGFGLLFVVGALTRRTSELVLAYLLVLVATIATLLGFSAFGFRSFLLPHPDGPSLIVTLAPWMVSAVALLLVVFYYARRQTAGIRSLTIAFAVLAPVVGGWSEASAIRKFAWPPEVRSDPWCQGAKVELDAAPADERMMKVGDYQGMLCIPVKCSGWPRDLMSYNVRSASISLTKPKEYGRWGISANNPFFRTDIFPGHEFIRLSLDELAREAPPGAKETPAELKLSVDLSLYRRVATVALPQNGQPAYVPGWGNVQLLVNDRGAHVVRLSALRPAERDWRYGLGNARSVTVVNAEWSGTMVDRDVSPISFRLSPVYTYVAEFVMPSGPPPLVFTANRLVGLGNCQLAIPQVRLADYATGRP
jgi:hypothetical protein